MKISPRLFVLATSLVAASAQAALVDTIADSGTALAGALDGTLGADEYGVGNVQRVGGSGSGFGGTLGNSQLYMDSDATTIKFGWQPGANVENNFALYLDTRDGGFTDAQMNDNADGGRRAVSNPTAGGTLTLDPSFVTDFAIVFGSFGVVSFETAAGGDGSLIFRTFDGSAFNSGADTDFREVSISKADFGITGDFDFVGILTSDSGFLSNESIPGGIAGDNPGFGATVEFTGFDRFTSVDPVPEPATLAALGLGAAALLRRRRR